MPRSGKEMRQRLRQAALELYREQGYEKTTTAQIAAHAGATERTFFRHFPDKREVMFEQEALRDILIAGLESVRPGIPPLEALLHAFRAAEVLLEENRPMAELREQIIAATPALQERLLTKVASLTNDLAGALHQRGLEHGFAMLAAQVGMAASGHAAMAWQKDPSQSYGAHLERSFACLRRLSD